MNIRENKEPVHIDQIFISIFCGLSTWSLYAKYTEQSIWFFIPPLMLQIVSTAGFLAAERYCRKTRWKHLFIPYGICTLLFIFVFWGTGVWNIIKA